MECDPMYMNSNYNYTIDKEVESKIFVADQQQQQNDNDENINLQSPPSTSTIETDSIADDPQYKCWAEFIGYPCCSSHYSTVLSHDENGDWGYDFTNNQRCGITPFNAPADEECWSEVFGYSCCKGCKVYETDKNGQWGYEDDK